MANPPSPHCWENGSLSTRVQRWVNWLTGFQIGYELGKDPTTYIGFVKTNKALWVDYCFDENQQSTYTFQSSISMDSIEVLKLLSFWIVGMSDLAPMTTPIGISSFGMKPNSNSHWGGWVYFQSKS